MQTCLDDLSETLDPVSLQKLADRLNRAGDGRLAAMWELVFLRALGHAGSVRHEMSLPDGKQPDFEWTISTGGLPIVVWGDVTTVSDASLDEKNPVDYLSDEITRLARKSGLNPNHFRYDVRGGRVGEYSKGVMRLTLPTHPELQKIVKTQVEPFIRALASKPGAPKHFACSQPDASFTVDYDQSQMYAGGGHTSYDVALSLTNNPIFKALKRKTSQLGAAPADAVRLIILCDADCASMSRKHVSTGQHLSRAIAEDFLRQNSSIDLVLLSTVRSEGGDWARRVELSPKFDLLTAPAGPRSARAAASVVAAVKEALELAVSIVPRPVLEPINAARRCMERGYSIGMRGGYMTTETGTIKISSRALLQLLAGELTSEEFLTAHGWNPAEAGSHGTSLFRQAFKSGRMIKAVKVDPAQDDDWLEFDFTAPDPAFSPFVAAQTKGKADA